MLLRAKLYKKATITRTGQKASLQRIRNLEGSAVIETVIVLAVIIAVALIFNTQIRAFAGRLFAMVFSDDSVLDALGH